MFASKTQAKLLTASTLVCLVAATSPAIAQTWSYSPYNGAANWLWLARSFAYPLNRYSSYRAPLYLANSLVYGGTYAASQAVTGGSRQYNYGNYTDEEPYYEPRQRTRPIVGSPQVQDQIVHAKRAVKAQQPAAPMAAPQPIFGTQSPMAQGFVELVNARYGGDISQALFDPNTRSYARAVGLINSDELFQADLSPEKVQTVKQIFADPNEDPMAKITTVRMLLKH